MMMAPGGTDVMPQCASFDDGCSKDGVYSVEVDDFEEKSSCQGKAGKPPRNDLPTMRHCISQAMLAGNSELENPAEIGIKSPPVENAEFIPVLRSGSCSEIGPKTYMEDEYICVDDLHERLGGDPNFPSPGAFYGVANFLRLSFGKEYSNSDF